MKKLKLIFASCFIASMSIGYTQSNYFVTTWNTEEGTGQTGNTTIMLPITSGRYDVDTSYDGITFNVDLINQKGTILIDFGPGIAGVHTIAVRPNPANNANSQLQINHQATGSTPEKLMSIDNWGTIVWTTMQNAFRDCSNMTIADDAGAPNLTGAENKVMSMLHMFSGATILLAI